MFLQVVSHFDSRCNDRFRRFCTIEVVYKPVVLDEFCQMVVYHCCLKFGPHDLKKYSISHTPYIARAQFKNVLPLEEGEILQENGGRVCYMFRGDKRERVRVSCMSYANAQKVFDSVEVLL